MLYIFNFLVKIGAIYYIKLLSLFKLPYILAYNALFGNKKTDKNLMTLDSLEMITDYKKN